MYDITFGLTATMWIVIALICGVVGWKMVNLGLGASALKFLKVICVVAVLIAAFAAGLFATSDDTTNAGRIVGGTAAWDWTHADGNTAGFCMANNTTATGDRSMLLTFLATGAGTLEENTCTISYTCFRTDTYTSDGVTRAYIIDAGSVTNVTTGLSYPGIEKLSTGKSDYSWVVGTTSYVGGDATFPSDPESRTCVVNFTFDVNGNAVDALNSYGSFTITVSVGGVTDTITIMRI